MDKRAGVQWRSQWGIKSRGGDQIYLAFTDHERFQIVSGNCWNNSGFLLMIFNYYWGKNGTWIDSTRACWTCSAIRAWASAGLLSVTKPAIYFWIWKGTIWSFVYKEPNKRLSKYSQLIAGWSCWSLIFKISNSSTIQALKTQIAGVAREGGRSTCNRSACRSGWGIESSKTGEREQSLAILPISARDVISDPAMFGAEIFCKDFFLKWPFDSYMALYLMMLGSSGDVTEALDTARQLEKWTDSIIVREFRKIGKTSILKSGFLHEARVHSRLCIYWRLTVLRTIYGSKMRLSCWALYRTSVTTASSCSPKYAEVVRYSKLEDNAYWCQSLLAPKLFKNTDGTVIMFFDEVDYITPCSPTAKAAWTADFNPFGEIFASAQESARPDEKTVSYSRGSIE